MKVLIVDDSLLAEHALRNYFIKLGHDVVGMARNAKTGKQMYRDLNPDIVTVDAIMPGESGPEFIAHINQIESQNGNRSKIIMISSDTISNDVKARIRVDSYIEKPVTMSKIEDTLRKLRI